MSSSGKAAGSAGPSFPIGRYLQANIDANGSFSAPLGQEICIPLWVPGSGTLASVAVQLQTLGDTTAALRLGVRADNGGIPGAVIAETIFNAGAGNGGVTGYKELSGLAVPYPGLVWVSVLGQGWAATALKLQQGVGGAAGSGGALLVPGGVGASLATIAWGAGHGPVAATLSGNNAGTIASAGPPTGSGVNIATPQIVIKRGT